MRPGHMLDGHPRGAGDGYRRGASGVTAGAVDAIMREHVAHHFPAYDGSGGHGIGVDFHEPPRLIPGEQTPLETDMVIALEPGVYLETCMRPAGASRPGRAARMRGAFAASEHLAGPAAATRALCSLLEMTESRPRSRPARSQGAPIFCERVAGRQPLGQGRRTYHREHPLRARCGPASGFRPSAS